MGNYADKGTMFEVKYYVDSSNYDSSELTQTLIAYVERFNGDYAYKVHDKDLVADTDQLVEPHIHFRFKLSATKELKTVCNYLKSKYPNFDTAHNVFVFDTKSESRPWYFIVRYLFHLDSPTKVEYPVADYVSNFDVPVLINGDSKKTRDVKGRVIFDAIVSKKITNLLELGDYAFAHNLYDEVMRCKSYWCDLIKECNRGSYLLAVESANAELVDINEHLEEDNRHLLSAYNYMFEQNHSLTVRLDEVCFEYDELQSKYKELQNQFEEVWKAIH